MGRVFRGPLNISDADILALPVPIPGGMASIKNQKKIADCLTSLDEAIAAQGRKVEALKGQKRGLMQQLFPTLDEVAA